MTGFPAALLLLGLALLAIGALYGVGQILTVARTPMVSEAFSGGASPLEHAASRYHVRWYTVTMLFLAFDMEMIFMYPWTLVISEMGTSSVVEMFTFLAVLVTGVLYAWREGALRWT